MKSSYVRIAAALALGALALVIGCENALIGERGRNLPPEVWLSSGPVEGDTTGYQVHFYWGGWDPDGYIDYYEFVVAPGNPYGFNQEDTTGIDKWLRTSVQDSIFRVSANDTFRTVTIGSSLYSRYDQTHTFFIRAVDVLGKRSNPVYRSFTAWTLAPTVKIDQPPAPTTTFTQSLSTITTFRWTGRDPIDAPENVQEPESIRYFVMQNRRPTGEYDVTFDLVGDLNAYPERYEDKWGPWLWYRASGDSGRSTVIGDDEDEVQLNRTHVFFVQAKDEAGAVTGIFDRGTNARQFVVTRNAGPVLTVLEPFLGGFKFLGLIMRPEKRDLPPGITLRFTWRGDASSYGGQIACYQYGWDVADVNNPDDWDSECFPENRFCQATWYTGVHTLFVKVVDNIGTVTLGQIEINIIPFTMERTLLWVDDFFSTDFLQTNYGLPTETEHDTFWLGHCSRAIGFDPDRDVFDCYYQHSTRPPEMLDIARYKNIIWTYSSSLDEIGWDNMIKFTPEALISTSVSVNLLPIFLAKGGHVLTEGNAQRMGGLAAYLPAPEAERGFPIYIKCETLRNQDGCPEGTDTTSVNSYPYKDYCVSMLDKILGGFRTDEIYTTLVYTTLKTKRLVRDYDVMIGGYRTTNDWHSRIPGFPSRLDLWSKVTEPTSYFYLGLLQLSDSRPGGFTNVEIYDPEYWMTSRNIRNRSCFNPMYRMTAESSKSVLDKTTIALFVTKYADVVPAVEGGLAVAAASFHFGLELWYFNRSQVDSIMTTILGQWQILSQ